MVLAAGAAVSLAGLAGTPAFAGGGEGCESCRAAWMAAAAPGAAGPVYPRDAAVDFEHMTLDLLIPDMNNRRMLATQTLKFKAKATEVDTVALDAKAMLITSALSDGRAVEFEHDGDVLTLRFDPPIGPDESVSVVTTYEVIDPPPMGIVWTTESPAWPGRAAQIHTQGQPETNSYWFPIHDFPNDRLTTEVFVTVPAGYIASSNGRQVSHTRKIRTANSDEGVVGMTPYDTFHWLQDKSHVPYLVSLVVGKFDVVEVGNASLSMPVYVPPGRAQDVPGTYGNTAEMVDFFAARFDEPYPWDRYAQLVVWNFAAGGMENTSATTMYDTAIFDRQARLDHDLDGLISHELAHQWFGDLITCNSWEHIWLNEGWATYSTALWFEHRDGGDAYLMQMRSNFDRVIGVDEADAPEAQGMASKVYDHPWEVFRRPANPYPKGASLLHMLRSRLGDDLFFKGVAAYIDEHKFGTVETSDFRQALEEVSGQSLDSMFRQWTQRPGVPRVRVTPAWDASTSTLRINADQMQRIDGDNPAFEFDLPIWISVKGSSTMVTLPVRGRSANIDLQLEGEPDVIAVDPWLEVLADFDVRQPNWRWLNQIQRPDEGGGVSIAARVQAVRALGSDTSVRTAEALRRLASDATQHPKLRAEAAKALGARGAIIDLRSLVSAPIDAWEVRQAAVEALTKAAADLMQTRPDTVRAVNTLLASRAVNDASLRVRAAAIEGLGTLKTDEYENVIRNALTVESQSDILRQAALRAIAELKTSDALDIMMQYSAPGFDGRTRSIAIELIPKVSDGQTDRALGMLTERLRDGEARPSRAAAVALVALRDPRAGDSFRDMIQQARTTELRSQYERWLKELEERLGQ